MARRSWAAPSPSPTIQVQKSVPGAAITLLGFPPAVFLHICLYMDPLSLIYVSRTSKRLRKALLSPKVDRLWVLVRENALPTRCKRPRDMSEAAWTCLLYYKHCHVCDKVGLKMLWSVHLRLCKICEELLKTHYIAGGGKLETYESMFHISNAFSTRPTRRQLRSKIVEDIESARPPAEPKESPLQIVTTQWTNYVSSYSPDPHDETAHGRFIPLPKDLLSIIELGENPKSLFYALRVIVRTLDFPQFFRAWAKYVEHGLIGLLPKSMDDRDAATAVWRPVSRAQQYLHAPAWWPHAAHLFMHISNPKGSSETRKLLKDVLCFDERASSVVRSLLVVFELDPLQSTVGILDSMNMYVQCALCVHDGEPERDGIVFHWRHAVFHACTAHQPSSPPRWRRLSQTHAVVAGKRDREHVCNTPVWKCGVCAWASRRTVTRAALEAHLVRVHEIHPGEIADGVHVYAQPDRDSLMGLAKPICLWELLENFANTSVLGLSQMALDGTTGNSDPLLDDPPEPGCVYLFCLRCPVHARRRHFKEAEVFRTHLRDGHEIEVPAVRGEDYDYL